MCVNIEILYNLLLCCAIIKLDICGVGGEAFLQPSEKLLLRLLLLLLFS